VAPLVLLHQLVNKVTQPTLALRYKDLEWES